MALFLPVRRKRCMSNRHHCVSVYLCVTRPYCIKTAKRRITQTTPCNSSGTLVFWRQNSLVDDPIPPKFALKLPPFQKAQFWPIFAHSASTVRAGEKSSISTNRKSNTRFPTSHRLTVYATPTSHKGWHKCHFTILSSKFQLLSKKSLQSLFVWKLPAAVLELHHSSI